MACTGDKKSSQRGNCSEQRRVSFARFVVDAANKSATAAQHRDKIASCPYNTAVVAPSDISYEGALRSPLAGIPPPTFDAPASTTATATAAAKRAARMPVCRRNSDIAGSTTSAQTCKPDGSRLNSSTDQVEKDEVGFGGRLLRPQQQAGSRRLQSQSFSSDTDIRSLRTRQYISLEEFQAEYSERRSYTLGRGSTGKVVVVVETNKGGGGEVAVDDSCYGTSPSPQSQSWTSQMSLPSDASSGRSEVVGDGLEDDQKLILLACKIIRFDEQEPSPASSAQDMKDFVLRELDLMSSLPDHPNVLKLQDHFVDKEECRMIFPLMKGGTLLGALSKRGRFKETEAREVLVCVLKGLSHLHANGVAHRDLKLENLLLAEEGVFSTVQISDLGMSKRLSSSDERGHTSCGSPLYTAPEVITESCCSEVHGKKLSHYGFPADLWSCGVVLYLMLAGYPPFSPSRGVYFFFQLVRTASFDFDRPVWKGISQEAKDLVSKLLVVDQTARLTAVQALEHPWIVAGSSVDAA